MNCTNCGNIQTEGNFCGKCGASLKTEEEKVVDSQATDKQAATLDTQNPIPSANEKVSSSLSQYITFFTSYIKNPSTIFRDQSNQFLGGLVTWILFVMTTGLLLYTAFDNFIQYLEVEEVIYLGNYFFKFFIKSSLYIAIYTGVIMLVLFGLVNLLIGSRTIKWVVQTYGTLLIPAILINIITWILVMLSAYTSALITFSLMISLVAIILPLVWLYQSTDQVKSKVDRVYLGIIYFVTYTIVSYILFFVILESTFINIRDYLEEIFYYW